jgi:nucleotide-binding universal stress UspA family protein
MLMMGAYGHGRQDRETLGSTAEHLLREVSCPVIAYGPRVTRSILEAERFGPALFPIAMPCNDAQIPGAIGLAKLFHCSVEVFYAVPYPAHSELKWTEQECLRVTTVFRAEGVRAGWSLVYGTPDLAVWSKSTELKSPFILMPLKRRKGLSATTSDNVAAHVIRHASVPVVTYTFD